MVLELFRLSSEILPVVCVDTKSFVMLQDKWAPNSFEAVYVEVFIFDVVVDELDFYIGF